MATKTVTDEVLVALDLARQLAAKSLANLPAGPKAAIAAFMQKLASLRKDWVELVTPAPPPEPKEKGTRKVGTPSPKEFKGKSGMLAKLGFRYLFDQKLVNAGDIVFLLSDASATEFKTKGFPVIVQTTSFDESCAYRNGIRRYAKMKPIESGEARYLVSTQFFDSSIEPMLKWFAKHGLSRAKVRELIRSQERK